MVWFIVSLAALSIGGIAWFCASGIDIRKGWQRGTSPLAKWLDCQRRDRFDEQLPEALMTMSNALRAGFSIAQAFDSVADQKLVPISDEFEVLRQQLHIGMPFEEALESMNQRVGSQDLELVITAIVISRKTGGNVTEVFDRISETIRGRMKIARKVKSLTAQGKLQGVIVSAMPLLLGVVMAMLKPRLMYSFITDPLGIALIVLMLALEVLGWWLIRKIIRIDV